MQRNHSAVKRIAARSDISIQEAVFWYNFLPREGTSEEGCTCNGIYKYKWRINNTIHWLEEEEIKTKFSIGESVWAKSGITRCTSAWKIGKITKILSKNKVEIDGIARHVLEIEKLV